MLANNQYKYKYYFFSKVFNKLINKFIFKGKRYNTEKIFDSFFLLAKKKRNQNFFLYFLECLNILKPEVGVRIFKFSKNKRVKRRKKGSKIPNRVKAVPIYVGTHTKFNIGLRWLIARIKSNTHIPIVQKVLLEVFSVILRKRNSALSDKRKLRELVLLNRGSTHYRW